MTDYPSWFTEQVQRGIEQADNGELLPDSQVNDSAAQDIERMRQKQGELTPDK